MALTPVVSKRSSKFSIGVKNWVKKTNKHLNKVVVQINILIFETLVDRSPVDTGLFKGNWQVFVNTPDEDVVDTKDKNGSKTKATGRRILRSVQPGDITYMMNNLPYARRLEYGWSQQAPQGIVRLTVTQFKPLVALAIRQDAEW